MNKYTKLGECMKKSKNGSVQKNNNIFAKTLSAVRTIQLEEQDFSKHNPKNVSSRISNAALSTTQTIKASRDYLNDGHFDEYNHSQDSSNYRSPSAQQAAKDRAFKNKDVIKDEYVNGNKLVKTQAEAREQYGNDWQKHTAEADHIDPLNSIHQRHKDDIWLKDKDLKDTINRDDNFAMTNKSTNASQGAKNKEDWYKNKDNLDNHNISKQKANRDIKKGQIAKQETEKIIRQKKINAIASEAHNAGVQGAISASTAVALQSAITNFVDVYKGNKDIAEAVKDISKNTVMAAGYGYVSSGALTIINRTLINSNSPFLKMLGNSNVPAKVITGAMVMGASVIDFAKGKISATECITQIGKNSLEFAVVGESAAIGQTVIPIPVVGAVIGSMVGMTLTGCLLSIAKKSAEKEARHKERVAIMEQCDHILDELNNYEKELNNYLNEYFGNLKSLFSEALLDMRQAVMSGDNFKVVTATNKMITNLGGTTEYSSLEQFKTFISSNENDEF